MTTFTPAYRDEAQRLYASMIITDEARVDAAARRILKLKPTLLVVAARTGVPWPWLGAVLYRESNLRTDRHIHNGDPLTARTVRVPKGRPPPPAEPPFDFAESACDALCVLKGLHRVTKWSAARQAFEAERYNGFGYRRRGLRSPYLWAGTNLHERGKYVADGVFNAGVMDSQVGVMPLVQRVLELDAASGAPTPAMPAPPHLQDAANQQQRKAQGAANTAVASGTAGAGTGGADAYRQVADVAGFDWASLGLWIGAAALFALAVWLAWRARLHTRAAAALRAAAAEALDWETRRNALPVDQPGQGST